MGVCVCVCVCVCVSGGGGRGGIETRKEKNDCEYAVAAIVKISDPF